MEKSIAFTTAALDELRQEGFQSEALEHKRLVR
jgi:hypothetical protein